jgi:hypothetical protein
MHGDAISRAAMQRAGFFRGGALAAASSRNARLHRFAPFALAALLALPAPPASAAEAAPAPATSVEQLISRLRAMPGFSAAFEEEKQIALLALPLRARGSVHFIPPDRLLRRVTEPEPSLLELDADRLVYTDAESSESLDLGANAMARVFAHTFTDVLAGDLERLRRTYEIEFRPEQAGPPTPETAWQLELVPSDPALARAIERISLRGHGLLLIDLLVREASGDSTLTRFAAVDPSHHFEDAEIRRLLRPPSP